MKNILYILIIIFILSISFNSVKADIHGSSLVGWWTLDTTRYGTGANQVIDSSGGGFTGTVTGTPVAKATMIQQGLEFDGGSVSSITTTYTGALTDFTACAWFIPLPSRTGYDRILDKDFSTGFWLGNNTGTNDWGGGIRNTDGNPLFTGFTLSDNKWYHLCIQRSGTTQTVILNASSTISSTISSTATDGTAPVRIGTSSFGSTDGCKCIIDDVRIYNRALSLAEVKQLYLQGKQFINNQ